MNSIQISSVKDIAKSTAHKKLEDFPAQKNQEFITHEAYVKVFGVPETFQNILSLVSENMPGKLATCRLVHPEWRRKTDAFLEHKWLSLKQNIPNNLDLIKTAIDQVEESYPNCFAFEKCKKLSKKILLPVFIEKKLKDVPLTVKGYEALQNEIEDKTLQTIWRNRIRTIFESYVKHFGHLAQFDMHSIPASDATAEKIEKFLSKNCNVLEQVETLALNNLGLTIIPRELELFTHLKKLDLSDNRITKIENLGNLRDLQELGLNNNQIVKIENLNNLYQLYGIGLNNNHIAIIENLDNLRQLQSLLLNNNLIEKIENLDNLRQLQILSLNTNLIEKIENLDNLRQLQILLLNNNLIEKIEHLSRLPCLRELSLYNNPIENILDLNNLQPLEKFNGFLIPELKERLDHKRKR